MKIDETQNIIGKLLVNISQLKNITLVFNNSDCSKIIKICNTQYGICFGKAN